MILHEVTFQIWNVICISIQVFAFCVIYEHTVDKTERKQVTVVILDGCDTWSLTLRDECIMRTFENMLLRKIFGLKREVVTGHERRLYNESFMIFVSHQMSFG